jgi:hypothetical protein
MFLKSRFRHSVSHFFPPSRFFKLTLRFEGFLPASEALRVYVLLCCFSSCCHVVVRIDHSDYRTVSPYWVFLVYVELIRAVWADDGDRPLLF